VDGKKSFYPVASAKPYVAAHTRPLDRRTQSQPDYAKLSSSRDTENIPQLEAASTFFASEAGLPLHLAVYDLTYDPPSFA
jgi:hypothetical protein